MNKEFLLFFYKRNIQQHVSQCRSLYCFAVYVYEAYYVNVLLLFTISLNLCKYFFIQIQRHLFVFVRIIRDK